MAVLTTATMHVIIKLLFAETPNSKRVNAVNNVIKIAGVQQKYITAIKGAVIMAAKPPNMTLIVFTGPKDTLISFWLFSLETIYITPPKRGRATNTKIGIHVHSKSVVRNSMTNLFF